MSANLDHVYERINLQKTALPVMYGDVDFDIVPERFTENVDESTAAGRSQYSRPPEDMIETARAYSMLGDVTADAYAALIPQYGFRKLIQMLQTACDHGIEAVEDAPPELVKLIAEMEREPEWLNMDLVREGARLNRLPAAVTSPWMIRGAFLATFLNKYAALPMALTGTLSDSGSARRVNETATFFASTTLPNALEKGGEGFKAAAMVRLMHSMVRFNVLRKVGGWDVKTYGIPIPQLDQMPAGLIDVFLLAYEMIDQGRTEFTEEERARVEFSRYRCYLLGLPEDLLMDTPQGIVDIMNARNGTLRSGFDDATCGALIRATMKAYLPNTKSIGNRMFNAIEKRFARVVFLKFFLNGNKKAAEDMGVHVSGLDFATALFIMPLMSIQTAWYKMLWRIPALKTMADKRLTRRVRKLLDRYGHAEFTTDAEAYRPKRPQATAAE